MSGTQVSSFGNASQNVLFDPLMARRQTALDTANQNALLQNQVTQQQLGASEQEMMARAAQGLLNLGDEGKMAAAYPGEVARLQSLGFAKNAPSQFPGVDALRRVASYGMTIPQQYQMGLVAAPGLMETIRTAFGGGGGQGGGSSGGGTTAGGPAPAFGGGGPSASVTMPPEYQAYYDEASRRTGIPATVLMAKDRQESGFNPGTTGQAGEIGISQIKPSTATDPGYGLTGVRNPEVLRDPRTAINFGADYLKARAGNINWSDPAQVAAALRAYNGGGDPNYAANVMRYIPAPGASVTVAGTAQPGAPSVATAVPTSVGTLGLVRNPDGSVGTPGGGFSGGVAARTGGTDVAGPGAGPAAPPPSSGVPAPQPIPPPPTNGLLQPPAAPAQPQLPPSGVNSPQYQQALELQRRALMLETQYPADPRAKMAAAALRQQAQTIMQTDSVVTLPDGRQYHPLTGKMDPAAAPAKNYAETSPGVFTSPGQDPIFAPPGRPVEGVGPDPNNPNGPPVPGHWITQSGTRTFFPSAAEPAQAGYTVRSEAYKRDSGQIQEYAKTGQAAQTDQVRLQEMQEALDRIETGPGTATRTDLMAWAHRWLPEGVANTLDKQTAGMSDAAAAELFNKYAFRNATSQERQTLGARGGAAATKMFIQSNPGLELLTDANQRMLKVMRIANQADIDYTQGAQEHFVNNEGKFQASNGKQYDSLATFDRDWQAQRNPQVYAAAAGALAGMPVADGEINGVKLKGWANGLSDAEYQRALNIVSRADPSAVVNGKTGRLSMQPPNTQSAMPPTMTGGAAAARSVASPDEAHALAPGTLYKTPDGRVFRR